MHNIACAKSLILTVFTLLFQSTKITNLGPTSSPPSNVVDPLTNLSDATPLNLPSGQFRHSMVYISSTNTIYSIGGHFGSLHVFSFTDGSITFIIQPSLPTSGATFSTRCG